jgi:hypothetical protein
MEEIVRWVAENDPLFETEYDGRMEYYCFYCGAYEDKGATKHKRTCLYKRAKKLIK